MACPRTEDLSALADQALPAPAQAALQRHLQTCPICRQQLQALQGLRQQLRALPSPTLGFDLAAQLHDRLPPRAPQPKRTGWKLWGWMPTGLAAGAALVSGLWLGGLLLGTGATVTAAGPAMARVFDPVPPGGLCAATEICRLPRALP
ncbi:MAG TPA: zf-HC2 domain-containing protein [Alicycliphilus sp.]|nr:zf-HC2 domain-containing protein [Alicycliphilus sp.]